MKTLLLIMLWLMSCPLLAQEVHSPLYHELKVALQPQRQTITVTDRITLPKPVANLTLRLHPGLQPRFLSDQGAVTVDKLQSDDDLERYRITLPTDATQVRVAYTGVIHHPLSPSSAEQPRGFRNSPGLIDAQGVFLG
jgi:hypothetical protein